jgi:hypothetical protein
MLVKTSVILTLGVVVLAGCGSSKKSTTTSATNAHALAPGATEIGSPPPVKSVTFRTSLSGAVGSPKGAPGGSARAILSIKAPTTELCWNFSALKNVASPTRARIYRSLSGGPGVGPGVVFAPTYKPAGCTRQAAVFLGLLGKVPENFFVSIDNAQFPHGAVRGRP